MTTIAPSLRPPLPPARWRSAVNNTEIASNFTTFLKLLTTQLQNQDPLSPMDTNQFTQQLVEFASVEQQMKSNDSLSTLVSLEQAAQSTSALNLVGATVVVDGSTTQLTNGSATWSLNVSKPATATVTIKDATGQTAYTGTFAVNAGAQNFVWDGHGNNGTHVAERHLHHDGDRDRRQRPDHGDLDADSGQGGFGRSHADPAASVHQWTELHRQSVAKDRRARRIHLQPAGCWQDSRAGS